MVPIHSPKKNETSVKNKRAKAPKIEKLRSKNFRILSRRPKKVGRENGRHDFCVSHSRAAFFFRKFLSKIGDAGARGKVHAFRKSIGK
jgi:hypothetical protein